MLFNGRVALVTGGARGLGAAITTMLAEEGAHVAAGYHRGVETAQALCNALRGRGLSISIHQGNVSNPEDCQRVANEVLAQQGHIDYLINNAGVTVDKTVRKMTLEEWHAVLSVNLSGTFNMSKAVLEHMLGRGFGRIVNISSVIGEMGGIGQANYAASKAGLFGFTKSLAQEVVKKGITVNCVSPGFCDTEMVAAVPKPILEGIIARIPAGRLGKPSEVAHAVRFLLHDEAAYMTGAVITVNGGLEM